MKWFREVFLPSFEKGKEIRISQKQYEIFVRYSKESVSHDYTVEYIGEGYNAYEWHSVAGIRYFVTVE